MNFMEASSSFFDMLFPILKRYKQNMNTIMDYLQERKPHLITDIASFSASDTNDYVQYLTDMSLPQNEMAEQIRTIKAFSRTLNYMGVTKDFAKDCVYQSNSPINCLSDEKLIKLLQQSSRNLPRDRRMKALLMMLLDTGVRVAEAQYLHVGNVNLDERFISTRASKSRIIPFGFETQKALVQYFKAFNIDPNCRDDLLFRSISGERLANIKAEIRDLVLKAGLKPVNCSAYDFRRTFVVRFLKNGGSISNLQRFLGHEDRRTIDRYLREVGDMPLRRKKPYVSNIDIFVKQYSKEIG